MDSSSPMSAGIMALLGDSAKLTSKDYSDIIVFQAKEIMSLKQEIESLKQENSQLKQLINSGTTSDKTHPGSQSETQRAGRKKKEVTIDTFRDALKDPYKNKAELIISWIKEQINLLEQDKDYCSAIKGKRRQMAPMYVVIDEEVFIPKSSTDQRPTLEGSPLERFFGINEGCYRKYSMLHSFRQGEIQVLKQSFESKVLKQD